MAADRDWRWIARPILGIGCLIIVVGLALGLGSLRHVVHGERANGEIVEVRHEGSMFIPVVLFRLPSGQTQEVKLGARGESNVAVGDRITILYMPQEPRDLRIDTFDRLWLSVILVSLFGGIWLLFATVVWVSLYGIDLSRMGETAFAIIAVITCLTGVFLLWSAADLYTGGIRGEGLVQDIQGTDDRASHVPVVRFTTRDGREVEFQGYSGSGAAFSSGDRVTVIYDAVNPSRARIVSFVLVWLPAAMPLAIAAIFGALVLLLRRRRQVTGHHA